MEWGIRERSQNTVCQHETLHQGLGGATLNFGGGVGSSVWSDLKGWVSRRGGQTGQSWCLGGTASASAGLKAGCPGQEGRGQLLFSHPVRPSSSYLVDSYSALTRLWAA